MVTIGDGVAWDLAFLCDATTLWSNATGGGRSLVGRKPRNRKRVTRASVKREGNLSEGEEKMQQPGCPEIVSTSTAQT